MQMKTRHAARIVLVNGLGEILSIKNTSLRNSRVVQGPIHTDDNTEGIMHCQWLSLEYIEGTGEVFFPDKFAYFLRPLLDGKRHARLIFSDTGMSCAFRRCLTEPDA